jgi:polysaccharide export outer membrane protein
MRRESFRTFAAVGVVLLAGSLSAQTAKPQPAQPAARNTSSTQPAPVGVTPPPGYVIGADDLLSVRFWGDQQLSADVVVRPDGMISLPLLNAVEAAGLTPEQLNKALEKAATKYLAEPQVTVIVREVRSRRVFVLGQVARPNPVPLNTDMTVLQVLSAAGGLLEYANKSDIVVLRTENGRERRFKFNFDEVIKGKNPEQNILLKPGDTVLVP